MRKECFEYGIAPSDIRSLFEYGKGRKALIGEENVFDFSIGNPSVPSPSIVNETLIKLLSSASPIELHGYTSGAGDKKVRDAISDYLNYTYKAKTEGSLIYLTCGAAAALSIALNALLNPGDEVILLAPFFAEYRAFASHAGGVIKVVKPDYSTFKPDFEDFLKAISPKTKVVIINSPNNPSGVIYDEETILRLTGILKEKEEEFGHRIYLLSDEPYRELVYDNTRSPFITNFYDDSLISYSFSKSLSMPGERIGYLLVNPKADKANEIFAAVCGAGRALGYVCAPSLFQHLIPSVLGITSNIAIYKKNRDLLYGSLTSLGYEAIYPSGAFYLLLKALEEDAYAFSRKAKEFELLLVPSDSFGVKSYVRLAYCVDAEMIKRSISAFKKLKESYGEK